MLLPILYNILIHSNILILKLTIQTDLVERKFAISYIYKTETVHVGITSS